MASTILKGSIDGLARLAGCTRLGVPRETSASRAQISPDAVRFAASVQLRPTSGFLRALGLGLAAVPAWDGHVATGGFAIGDMDGDGDLDPVFACLSLPTPCGGCRPSPNLVWLNSSNDFPSVVEGGAPRLSGQCSVVPNPFNPSTSIRHGLGGRLARTQVDRAPPDARLAAGASAVGGRPFMGIRAMCKRIVTVVFASLWCGLASAQQPVGDACPCRRPEFLQLSGPYMGQEAPSYLPKVFLPGIISENGMAKHSAIAFSPDGTEAYWSVASGGLAIYHTRLVNGQWTKPEIPFFAKGLWTSSPVFSVDGMRLYFSSQTTDPEGKVTPSENHDLAGEKPGKRERFVWLCYVERENGAWSQPRMVDPVINTGDGDYQVSLTRDGAMYFSRNGSIHVSRLVEGKHALPVKLGDAVNTTAEARSVFVAPDESYLLFTRMDREARRITGRPSDFCISYRKPDGTWTQAEEISDLMGETGCSHWITVSPDGKYIFYTSRYPGRMSNVYWCDTGVIGLMRPKDLE